MEGFSLHEQKPGECGCLLCTITMKFLMVCENVFLRFRNKKFHPETAHFGIEWFLSFLKTKRAIEKNRETKDNFFYDSDDLVMGLFRFHEALLFLVEMTNFILINVKNVLKCNIKGAFCNF